MSNIDKQAGEGDVSPKTYYIHPMAFGGTQNPGYGHVPVVHAEDFEKERAKLEAAEKRIAELEELEVNFSLPAELTVEDCDVLARTIEYGTGWNLAISSCEEKFIHALNSAGISINRED